MDEPADRETLERLAQSRERLADLRKRDLEPEEDDP
jgi:hypothetical protein